ncbi:hypothetical protein QBC43DRAFT_337109 [Cladorrhinum sp. PSN259]|nr:hypothetical protein QBC43DRAFT_337109 [Cladorrhinum sp. PSN259]
MADDKKNSGGNSPDGNSLDGNSKSNGKGNSSDTGQNINIRRGNTEQPFQVASPQLARNVIGPRHQGPSLHRVAMTTSNMTRQFQVLQEMHRKTTEMYLQTGQMLMMQSMMLNYNMTAGAQGPSVNLNSGPPAAPRVDTSDLPAGSTRCENCGRQGHRLSQCIRLDNISYDIPGCPICETTQHLIDDCPRLPSLSDRDAQIFRVLVGLRGCKGPIRSAMFNWPDIAATGPHMEFYAWTRRFAKQWQDENPKVWETYDYSNESLLAMDPRTKSRMEILKNIPLNQRYLTEEEMSNVRERLDELTSKNKAKKKQPEEEISQVSSPSGSSSSGSSSSGDSVVEVVGQHGLDDDNNKAKVHQQQQRSDIEEQLKKMHKQPSRSRPDSYSRYQKPLYNNQQKRPHGFEPVPSQRRIPTGPRNGSQYRGFGHHHYQYRSLYNGNDPRKPNRAPSDSDRRLPNAGSNYDPDRRPIFLRSHLNQAESDEGGDSHNGEHDRVHPSRWDRFRERSMMRGEGGGDSMFRRSKSPERDETEPPFPDIRGKSLNNNNESGTKGEGEETCGLKSSERGEEAMSMSSAHVERKLPQLDAAEAASDGKL